jgi:predicted PurR-regulated permease PerM
MKQTIDISTSSILKFIFIVLALAVLYYVRDVLIMIFVALVLAIALDRPIDFLCDKKVPRLLAAILVYFLLFSVLGLIFYLVFPVLAEQIKNLANNYSFYLDRINRLQAQAGFINLKEIFLQLPERLVASAQTVTGTLIAIFGGLMSFLTIIVVAIFFNAQEKGVKKFIFYLTPHKHQPYVFNVFEKIQQKVGGWLWGRVIISLIMGAMVSAGLFLLGVKYAVLLGALAFLFGFIPMIGPIVASIPAILLGLSMSPVQGLLVALIYIFIYSLFENFVLIPVFMKKAVDLNPALIFIVILLGGKMAGTWGALLAIPVAGIISVFVEDYMQQQRMKKDGEKII